jgi:hypothetical protein
MHYGAVAMGIAFSYKDYADQGKKKCMTLESGAFLNAFAYTHCHPVLGK